MSDRCPGEERLSARLDGAVGPDVARQVDAHVDGCAECRRRLDELAEVRSVLRSLPHRQVPPEVVRAAAEAAAQDGASRARRARAGLVAATIALAVATGAVADHHTAGHRLDGPAEVAEGARLIEAMDREQLVDAVARERITRVPAGALDDAPPGDGPTVELVDDAPASASGWSAAGD